MITNQTIESREEQFELATGEVLYRSWMASAEQAKTEASIGITHHRHLAKELHEAGDYHSHAFHKLIEQWWTQQFVAAEDLIGNLYRSAPASYR